MSTDMQERRIKDAEGLDVLDLIQDMDKKHYPGILHKLIRRYLSKLENKYPNLMDRHVRGEVYTAYQHVFASAASEEHIDDILESMLATLPPNYTEAQKLPFAGWACYLMGSYIHAAGYLMQTEACNIAHIDSYSECVRRHSEGDIEASRILADTFPQYIETMRKTALEVYTSFYK